MDKTFAFAPLYLLLCSCSSVTTTNSFTKQLEKPKPTVTGMTQSLACFGDMLADYNRIMNNGRLRPIRAAIMTAKDATDVSTKTYANSEIPTDFKDMAIGIASKIGGPVRVLHVPGSVEIVDAIRLNTTNQNAKENITPFTARHYNKDSIQIYGAITEYDRLLSNSQIKPEASAKFGGGDGLTNIEASMKRERNVARMTIDFRVVHPNTGDVLNHAGSTNTVELYQVGKDNSFGLSIGDQSIGFAMSDSLVDARHKAIRLLVERGLIESLGKYAKVPYWRCLPSEKKQKFVKFEDVLAENSGLYDFSSASAGEKVSKRDYGAKLEKAKKKGDLRDQTLIMSVKSDFEFVEYINRNTREYKTRPMSNFVFGGEDLRKTKNGRRMIINNFLAHYKRNLPELFISGEDPLVTIKRYFISNGVLNEASANNDSELFLAMWLNAPVRKGARWVLK